MRKMLITKKDVEYAAALARLEFSEEEKEMYTRQLDMILGYVKQLNELDTEGVPPTYHIIPLSNVMREDEVRTSMDRDKALSNAPDIDKNCFRVPKIFE
ncbi:MAG: Asp-tRNA(Asn)/Glu-tRNA(Gln) amidotransferase subunit GatC [Caulobacteraceae bacterium]